MSVAPGWYVDPADPETRRYWDGEGWIGAPIPVDATPPEGPPPAEPAEAPPTPEPAAPAAPAPVPPAGPGQQPPSGHGQPGPGYGPQQGPPPGWPYPNWVGRPPEPRPHGLPLASFGARLVARLIDFGILFVLNAVVNGWFVWRYIQEMSPTMREVWSRFVTQERTTEPLPPAGEQAGGLQIAIVLIAAALWLAYEVPSMATSGQTVGKRVMRVKVLPVTGDAPLGFGRALRRWNTLGLPTLLWFCCIGFLLQLIDALSPLFDHPMRQALHDKRAQTVVVQLPRTTPNDRANPPGDTP